MWHRKWFDNVAKEGGNMFSVGDIFLGSTDGNVFRITDYRASRVNVGLEADYALVDSKGKIEHVTENLLNWLVKSGGLLRDFQVASHDH